jgi:hypothetical protein
MAHRLRQGGDWHPTFQAIAKVQVGFLDGNVLKHYLLVGVLDRIMREA